MERDEFSEAFYQLSKRRSMQRKLDRLLRAYFSMGLLMAILSAGGFVLTLLPFELSGMQLSLLGMTGVGIALALMSKTVVILRKGRESEELERLREYGTLSAFVSAWARFERTSKEVLAREGEEFNKHSLRSVISRLHEEGRIGDGDVSVLEEALLARNLIVHGGRPLSVKVAETITDSLAEIINKIAMPL